MGGLFSWFKSSRTVSVTFTDEAGEPIFHSDMAAGQLPETFVGLDTTFHIKDDEWHVVRAEPMTAAEYTRSGKLTVIIQRVMKVSPEDLYFSLPSIDTTWAFDFDECADGRYVLDLREDDWRQHEFFPAGDIEAVQEEMGNIVDIWNNRSKKSGDNYIFSECHARTIPAPDLHITVSDILELLQPGEVGVAAIHGQRLKNSIAFVTELHEYYGTVEDGKIQMLAMFWGDKENSPEILKLVSACNLIFVNWPACEIRSAREAGD